MAKIEIKFMRGNKSTIKSMSTVYSEKKGDQPQHYIIALHRRQISFMAATDRLISLASLGVALAPASFTSS